MKVNQVMYEIIDIRLDEYELSNVETEITLIKSDKTEVLADYILVSASCLYNINKYNLKDELLSVINKIYKEHIKLKLLNLSTPIFSIESTSIHNINISLAGFNVISKHEKYIVPNYITSIHLRADIDTVDILEIRHKMNVIVLGQYSKVKQLIGIENISSIIDEDMYLVDRTANIQNGLLELKCLDMIHLSEPFRLNGIKKIIFKDTCTINNIPSSLLERLWGLNEITLCKSIGTIENRTLEEYLHKDAETNEYYIKIPRTQFGKRYEQRIIIKGYTKVK